VASDLIERTGHAGRETRSGSIPAGVSLRWGWAQGARPGARGVSRAGSARTPLASILNGRHAGWRARRSLSSVRGRRKWVHIGNPGLDGARRPLDTSHGCDYFIHYSSPALTGTVGRGTWASIQRPSGAIRSPRLFSRQAPSPTAPLPSALAAARARTWATGPTSKRVWRTHRGKGGQYEETRK
jgi:hypothetical protein